MWKKHKTPTKTQRKEIRLQKAKQWIVTYNGTPKHMARNYRKRFHVDINTALSDLQAIGVELTPEYLAAVKSSEEDRIHQKRVKREQRLMEENACRYEDSDDTFGHGMVQYTFENLCLEDTELKLEGGGEKIFFDINSYIHAEDEDVKDYD